MGGIPSTRLPAGTWCGSSPGHLPESGMGMVRAEDGKQRRAHCCLSPFAGAGGLAGGTSKILGICSGLHLDRKPFGTH